MLRTPEQKAAILARVRAILPKPPALATADEALLLALVDDLEASWASEDLAWRETLAVNEAYLAQRNIAARMWSAIRWACGYDVEGLPDFGEVMETEIAEAATRKRKFPPYWWRTHLQRHAGMEP